MRTLTSAGPGTDGDNTGIHGLLSPLLVAVDVGVTFILLRSAVLPGALLHIVVVAVVVCNVHPVSTVVVAVETDSSGVTAGLFDTSIDVKSGQDLFSLTRGDSTTGRLLGLPGRPPLPRPDPCEKVK